MSTIPSSSAVGSRFKRFKKFLVWVNKRLKTNSKQHLLLYLVRYCGTVIVRTSQIFFTVLLYNRLPTVRLQVIKENQSYGTVSTSTLKSTVGIVRHQDYCCKYTAKDPTSSLLASTFNVHSSIPRFLVTVRQKSTTSTSLLTFETSLVEFTCIIVSLCTFQASLSRPSLF